MIRRLTFQSAAVNEANEAYWWYEDQVPGLGGEFYRELTRCLDFVMENPILARIVYRDLRKRKLDRFPYVIFYRLSETEVSIVSVFPASRDPNIWKKRANKS